EAALPAGIAAVQNWYGLLNRKDEPILELCAANGIAWVPFFPLGSAFSASPRFENLRHVRDVPEVQEIAAELEATPAQVGLAWLLAHAPNALLIPGTADPEHLRENLAAADLRIPAKAMARVDALAGPPAPTGRASSASRWGRGPGGPARLGRAGGRRGRGGAGLRRTRPSD